MLTGSLFSGYGGLDLAIEHAFTDTHLAWVADNDPAPSRVLEARFDSVPNLGDVTRFDWKRLERVEVMSGGTPCQDVSHAGHRKGMSEGTRSNLWVAMREGIAALRPDLVVWENVKGVVNAHASSDLEHCPGCMGSERADQPRLRALGRVLGDLAELRYDAAWIDVRAADVGAPHLRTRIFLLAWPEDNEPRWSDLLPPADPGRTDVVLTTPLLPTPVVNDMGDGKTVEWWDAWAPRQKASDGTTAVHGPSLAIEAVRLMPTPTRSDGAGGAAGHRGGGPNLRTVVVADAWGKYAPAIQRWATVLDREPPAPTETSPTGIQRLAPPFVEWLMGLPAGWVTDPELELTRNQQLRALGNGVVPQQGAHAIRELIRRMAGRQADLWLSRGSESIARSPHTTRS